MQQYRLVLLTTISLGMVSCSHPSTGNVSPITATLTPQPAAIPSGLAEPSPTPDYSRYAWSVYRNDELGYSFEFPSPCGLRVWRDNITFGGTSYLEVFPANGSSLDEYVDQLLQELDQKDGPYHPTKEDRLIHHEPKGIFIQALIAHHTSVFAVFEHGDMIFQFWSRLSLDCTIPEAGLTNPDSFYHSVESFAFIK